MKKVAELLKKAPEIEPDNGHLKYNTNTSDAIYRLLYMVYLPESPKGRGTIEISIPNEREYKRVRRQLARRSPVIRFWDSAGEPYVVQLGPHTIAMTTDKTTVKSAVPGTKSKIVLPSQDAISNLQ